MAGLDAMQKREHLFPMPGSEPRFLGLPSRCPAFVLVKLQTSEKLRLVFVLDVYTVCALKLRFVMCGREHITLCFLVRLADGEVVF